LIKDVEASPTLPPAAHPPVPSLPPPGGPRRRQVREAAGERTMPPLHSTIPPTPAPAVPNQRCSQHSTQKHHLSSLPQVCRVFVDNLIFAGPETLSPGQASGHPPPSRTKWTRRVPHPVLIGRRVPLAAFRPRLRMQALRQGVQGGPRPPCARRPRAPPACACCSAAAPSRAGAGPTDPGRACSGGDQVRQGLHSDLVELRCVPRVRGSWPGGGRESSCGAAERERRHAFGRRESSVSECPVSTREPGRAGASSAPRWATAASGGARGSGRR